MSGADPVSNEAAPSSPTLPLLAALKDATLAALVAFGLFFFGRIAMARLNGAGMPAIHLRLVATLFWARSWN